MSDVTKTKKHETFVREPMGTKGVEELAGIGKAIAADLRKINITKAKHVLGQFLLLDESEEDFLQWFTTVSPSSDARTRKQCFQCLREWSAAHL